MAKILHLPLVWLVNCSGVKLTEQEKVYANRRGQGTCFFRHAELEQDGVPVIAGIYGTNPPGDASQLSGIYERISWHRWKALPAGPDQINEFVTLCCRDRVPIIWFQDTSGIDVGDTAEKAELLGLGQSLIYSIEQTELPMMLVDLRKGTAAAHSVLGGPTANNHNAFTLGTAATEINVMHGETTAAAAYARRLVKEKDAGKSLDPAIEKMNDLVKHYAETSRPMTAPSKVSWMKSFASRTSGNIWSLLQTAPIKIRNPSVPNTI